MLSEVQEVTGSVGEFKVKVFKHAAMSMPAPVSPAATAPSSVR